MDIALLLVLGAVIVGCALVRHRVHTLNLTLVPPMGAPTPADGRVVYLDAYRERRTRAAGGRRTHSAS